MMEIDRRSLLAGISAIAAFPTFVTTAAAAIPVRMTSIKFGSVSWLIETIRAQGLDKKHGLDLQVLEVAAGTAGPVALLSGDADVIVSDWTWALRQRAKGYDLKFAPYSSALGSLVVPAGSPVKSLADLKGKKIGVAGSGIDKSWLLLRAYSRKVLGDDIAKIAQPVFGAAPLVTEEFRNGRLDAVLNFWTYAARLTGSGSRQVLSMADVIQALNVNPPPALVGFVWSEKATREKGVPVEKLLAAADDANAALKSSDAAWEHLRPLVQPASDAELAAIKAYYRSGITDGWDAAQTASAEKLTKLLIDLGDAELVGDGARFDASLFYTARG